MMHHTRVAPRIDGLISAPPHSTEEQEGHIPLQHFNESRRKDESRRWVLYAAVMLPLTYVMYRTAVQRGVILPVETWFKPTNDQISPTGNTTTQDGVKKQMKLMGVLIFGSNNCPWSRKQLEALGIADDSELFVNCDKHPEKSAHIEAFPSWKIGGKIKPGFMSMEQAKRTLEAELMSAYNMRGLQNQDGGSQELLPLPTGGGSAVQVDDITDKVDAKNIRTQPVEDQPVEDTKVNKVAKRVAKKSAEKVAAVEVEELIETEDETEELSHADEEADVNSEVDVKAAVDMIQSKKQKSKPKPKPKPKFKTKTPSKKKQARRTRSKPFAEENVIEIEPEPENEPEEVVVVGENVENVDEKLQTALSALKSGVDQHIAKDDADDSIEDDNDASRT